MYTCIMDTYMHNRNAYMHDRYIHAYVHGSNSGLFRVKYTGNQQEIEIYKTVLRMKNPCRLRHSFQFLLDSFCEVTLSSLMSRGQCISSFQVKQLESPYFRVMDRTFRESSSAKKRHKSPDFCACRNSVSPNNEATAVLYGL